MHGGNYENGIYPGPELQRNKLAYCQLCGYRCILLRNEYATQRSPGWDKLLALRDALRTKCSVTLWLDADAVVLRPMLIEPLATIPISVTRDHSGLNTGVMLLQRSLEVERLLTLAWNQTQFIPNRLGAEQSGVRNILYMHKGLMKSLAVYMNLVRYSYGQSSTQKWNRTYREAAPIYHAAGCAMHERPTTCGKWLRTYLATAQSQWEGRPRGEVACRPIDKALLTPRRPRLGDVYIPYGQGRDIVVGTAEAARKERAAVQAIERRACDVAGKTEVCASAHGMNRTRHGSATKARRHGTVERG